MAENDLIFNGLDGDTGAYDLPPMNAEELVRRVLRQRPPENLSELRRRRDRARNKYLGAKEGVNATRLEEAGWGVILPRYPEPDADRNRQVAAIREALSPLLELRRHQAGERFAEWTQGVGKEFLVGRDTKDEYLKRFGMGPGPADPDRVPYYLLIVGSPAVIPYRFQSQLDVQYAVGRIHFRTLQEYADYAAAVVAAASSPVRLRRRAAFFGAANPDDRTTELSSTLLVAPLAEKLGAAYPAWDIAADVGPAASRSRLASLLGGGETPALLFTAGHGVKFARGSKRQFSHQGALVTSDWPGPTEWQGEISEDFYFAGDHLADSADLLGLIAFFFACYGGGTPQRSEFAFRDAPGAPAQLTDIAPFPFVARLPARMLGRPRGALAVVAHVERTWTYSFRWREAGAQTNVFQSALERLLKGEPVGYALEYFNQQYAELSTMLADELSEIQEAHKRYDPYAILATWTANNDARGYAIIGDPAVRLPIAPDGQEAGSRAAIEVSARPLTGGIELSEDIPAPAAEGAESPSIRAEDPGASLAVEAGPAGREVRTYISADLAHPGPADLKIITRRAADGAIETIVAPDVADNTALLDLHRAAVEQASEE